MIVPVKKIRLITLKENKENLLDKLQKKASFMPLRKLSDATDSSYEVKFKKIEQAIGILDNLRKKSFFEYQEVSNEDFSKTKEITDDILNKVLMHHEIIEDSKKRMIDLEEKSKMLFPYKNLSVTTKELNEMKEMESFIGYIPIDSYSDFSRWVKFLNIHVEELESDEHYQYLLIVSTKKSLDYINQKISYRHFMKKDFLSYNEKIDQMIINEKDKVEKLRIDYEQKQDIYFSLEERIINQDKEKKELTENINKIVNYKNLRVKSMDLHNLSLLKYKFLQIAKKALDKLKIDISKINMHLEVISEDKLNYYTVLIYDIESESRINEIIETYQAVENSLPVINDLFIDYYDQKLKLIHHIEKNEIIEKNQLKNLEKEIDSISFEYQKAKTILEAFLPYEKLEMSTKEINKLNLDKSLSESLKDVVLLGSIENELYEQVIDYFNLFNIKTTFLSQDANRVYVKLDMTAEHLNIIENSRVENLVQVNLPTSSKLLKDKIKEYQEELIVCEENIKNSQNQLKSLTSNAIVLKMQYDYLFNEYLRSKIVLSETNTTIHLEGFVREDEYENLKKELDSINSYIEVLSILENEQVPTATKNNRFVKQFETITNMFSVPNSKEVDPNPIMSIWYWIIFGLMMGDIGYGLLMIVVFSLFIKLKKPKGELRQLVSVFAYSGVTSIIFGVLFGSFFGASFDFLNTIGKFFGNSTLSSTVLEPVTNPLPMLIVSLSIGVLHIITGLILKVIKEISNKNYHVALSEGLSWILVLTGIVFYVLVKPVVIGFITVGIGLSLILLFKGFKEKGIIKKFMSGLGGLYGITNYLSDVLSYSRILALSLSTSVIAFTMNMLANMVSGSFIGYIFAVVIYLIGHIFNFSMGLLSAYVHDGRLQYLEFFGKFYEGGGYEFKPFEYELKYINQIKEK